MSAKAARAVAEEGLKGLSVEVAQLTEGTLSTAPRFTWGDAVRIKRSAPVELRGGQCGAVVSITEVDTQEKAGVHNVPVGSTVYQVEFGDGGDVKIEGARLEADEGKRRGRSDCVSLETGRSCLDHDLTVVST